VHAELKIASNISDAGALADELKDFARKVSESGRVTFNARSGSHDDLVLSLAIALFAALNRNGTVYVPDLGPGKGTYGSSSLYVGDQNRRLFLRSAKPGRQLHKLSSS